MLESLVGFIGVIIGSSIVVIHERLSESRRRTRQARYLAMLAVITLNEFIRNCDELLHDAWIAHDLQVPLTNAKLPSGPRFSSDLDWPLLNDQIVHDMLTLADKTETTRSIVAHNARESGGFLDYEEATTHYEPLILEAKRLTNLLRRI